MSELNLTKLNSLSIQANDNLSIDKYVSYSAKREGNPTKIVHRGNISLYKISAASLAKAKKERDGHVPDCHVLTLFLRRHVLDPAMLSTAISSMPYPWSSHCLFGYFLDAMSSIAMSSMPWPQRQFLDTMSLMPCPRDLNAISLTPCPHPGYALNGNFLDAIYLTLSWSFWLCPRYHVLDNLSSTP